MLTLAAIGYGFALDLLLGDPPRWPHLVIFMGRLIERFEAILRRVFPATPAGELAAGAVLAMLLPVAAYGAAWSILYVAGLLHPLLRLALESLFIWQCLALRSLGQAGTGVQQTLDQGDLSLARTAVGRVVGRDTANLDEAGIIRATVETVSENASDGVIAPLLYMLLGGAPLAVAYKAINTMDSMVGYRNAQYNYFGRWAARLDDVANFIPARISGLLMIAAAPLAGLSGRGAWRIFNRDRLQHSSPNSGHTEAACAGALGIRLGGGAYYDGFFVAKPHIGDSLRQPQTTDISSSIRLLYGSCLLALLLGLLIRGLLLCL